MRWTWASASVSPKILKLYCFLPNSAPWPIHWSLSSHGLFRSLDTLVDISHIEIIWILWILCACLLTRNKAQNLNKTSSKVQGQNQRLGVSVEARACLPCFADSIFRLLFSTLKSFVFSLFFPHAFSHGTRRKNWIKILSGVATFPSSWSCKFRWDLQLFSHFPRERETR